MKREIKELLKQVQNENEERRLHSLNCAIHDEFGHLAPDEVEILASDHGAVISALCEAIWIGKRKCQLQKVLKLDAPISIKVPQTITTNMKKYDMFWTVVGFKDGVWRLLYLSPHYLSGPAIEKWAEEFS
jgi:hypothetical protein